MQREFIKLYDGKQVCTSSSAHRRTLVLLLQGRNLLLRTPLQTAWIVYFLFTVYVFKLHTALNHHKSLYHYTTQVLPLVVITISSFSNQQALMNVNARLRDLYPDSEELFDIVLMTNNHAQVGVRLINSINHYGMDRKQEILSQT